MFKAKARFLGSNQLESIATDGQRKMNWNNQQLNHDEISWQAPVSGTVFGTLLNFHGEYEALKAEMNEPPYEAPPKHPVLYIKPVNTLNSHLRPVPLPENETTFEVGAGLGVVIGETATRLTEETALNYVAGYTVVADYSIPHTSFYRPDIKNKVRDLSCVIGPWIIDKNEVSNPDQLAITVDVNGKTVHENNTQNMIRSVATLLAEVTDFMTLQKGDLFIVGTPENKPQITAGDTVTITIDQVGRLENTVIQGGDA